MSNATAELLSVRIKEACRLTGIGRSKLYELIASGDLEIVKVGAITLVSIDSLKKLVQPRGECRCRMYAQNKLDTG